jgi:Flp pilus assembly protein TadD
VAGCAAIVLAVIAAVGKDRIDASRDAVRAGNLTAAASDARDAQAVQPWAPLPRTQLALVQERAGDLGSARRSLNEALQRAPEDWSLWLLAVRIDTNAGDRRRARRELARARQLNPRSDLLRPPR